MAAKDNILNKKDLLEVYFQDQLNLISKLHEHSFSSDVADTLHYEKDPVLNNLINNTRDLIELCDDGPHHRNNEFASKKSKSNEKAKKVPCENLTMKTSHRKNVENAIIQKLEEENFRMVDYKRITVPRVKQQNKLGIYNKGKRSFTIKLKPCYIPELGFSEDTFFSNNVAPPKARSPSPLSSKGDLDEKRELPTNAPYGLLHDKEKEVIHNKIKGKILEEEKEPFHHETLHQKSFFTLKTVSPIQEHKTEGIINLSPSILFVKHENEATLIKDLTSHDHQQEKKSKYSGCEQVEKNNQHSKCDLNDTFSELLNQFSFESQNSLLLELKNITNEVYEHSSTVLPPKAKTKEHPSHHHNSYPDDLNNVRLTKEYSLPIESEFIHMNHSYLKQSEIDGKNIPFIEQLYDTDSIFPIFDRDKLKDHRQPLTDIAWNTFTESYGSSPSSCSMSLPSGSKPQHIEISSFWRPRKFY